MFIANNIHTIQKELSEDITLVAVSKTKSVADILKAYHAGQRDFGENKVQEMCTKYDELPKDIHWHMIGHLQRNKVKYLASFVHLIHGVDRMDLLKEIDKQAQNHQRVIPCLLQVHIAEEETKFGFDISELEAIIRSDAFKKLKNIHIVGLMGMATFTDNENQIRKEFKTLKTLFDQLKLLNTDNLNMEILSMGMSGDYKIAISEGSNMVRVGSAIFGDRNYVAS